MPELWHSDVTTTTPEAARRPARNSKLHVILALYPMFLTRCERPLVLENLLMNLELFRWKYNFLKLSNIFRSTFRIDRFFST